MHLFEYKLQRCPYKGTIVYILYVVCTVHGTQYDICTFILLYSVLIYYTVHVSGIKYKK